MAMQETELAILVKVIDQATGKFQDIARGMVGELGKIAVEAVAFREIYKAMTEAEDVAKKLSFTLSGVGLASGVTSEQVNKLANALQATSKYSTNEVKAASEVLVRFGAATTSSLDETVKIAAALAQQMGTSLPEAANLLARALLSPANSARLLRQIGVQLSEDQLKQIRGFEAVGNKAGAQAVLMAELRRVTADVSPTVTTFTEAMRQLGNQVSTLLEGSDGGLHGATDALKELTKSLSDPELKENADAFFGELIKDAKAFLEVVTASISGLGLLVRIGKDAIDKVSHDDTDLDRNRKLLRLADENIANIYANGGTPSASDFASRNSYAQWINNYKATAPKAVSTPFDGKSELDAYQVGLQKFDEQKAAAEKYQNVLNANLGAFGSPLQQLTAKNALDLKKISESGLSDSDQGSLKAYVNLKFRLDKQDLQHQLDTALDGDVIGDSISQKFVDKVKARNATTGSLGTDFQKSQIAYNDALDKAIALEADLTDETSKQFTSGKLGFNEYLDSMEKIHAQYEQMRDDQQALVSSKFWSALETEAARYEKAIAQINDLVKGGFLSPEEGAAARKREGANTADFQKAHQFDDFKSTLSPEWRSQFDGIFSGVKNSIAQFIIDPFKQGLKGLASGIIQTFQTAIANVIAQKIVESAFTSLLGASGNGGGFLGSIFSLFSGGSHAGGGTISAGRIGLVGENGPELVAAGMSSMSVLNSRQLAFGGAGGGGINYAPVTQFNVSGNVDSSVKAEIIDYVERARKSDQQGFLKILYNNGFGRLR
jgi:Prophage tail length tape measure protein